LQQYASRAAREHVRGANVTVPESMMIGPVSVDAVLIVTALSVVAVWVLLKFRSVALMPPAKVNPPEPVIIAEIVFEFVARPPIQITPSLPPKASVPFVMLAPPLRIKPAGVVPLPRVSVLLPRLTVVPFCTLKA
jgi:hypothetical protein